MTTTSVLNPGQFVSGGGVFDPSAIATHHSLFWAQNPAQSFVANAQHAQWDDMSGNAHHASDLGFGAQYQPYYRPSVAGLGGKPAFEFDGVDDFFLQTTAYTALTQPFGLVVIGAATDRASGEIQAYVGGADSGGVHRADIFTYSDNLIYANAGVSIGGGTAGAAAHLFIAEFNGASSKLWQDGTQIATGNAGTQGPTGLIIGAIYNIQFPLDGHVALVGLKSSAAFTSGERAAYLSGSQSHYGTP